MKAIFAVANNWVIGRNGKIPWRVSEDLQFFKITTMFRQIIVGRKTFDNLPVLPGRDVVVLSNKLQGHELFGYHAANARKCTNLYIRNSETFRVEEFPLAIIAGGAEIYKQYLPLCSEVFMTYFTFDAEGDTIFPFSLPEIYAMFPQRELVKKLLQGNIWRLWKQES